MAVAAALAVRRIGYSWPKTAWAAVIVWGLCMLVMMGSLRVLKVYGIDEANALIGFIGFAVVAGYITYRVIRTR